MLHFSLLRLQAPLAVFKPRRELRRKLSLALRASIGLSDSILSTTKHRERVIISR